MVETAVCPRCSFVAAREGRFCPNCGADLGRRDEGAIAVETADQQLLDSLRRATAGDYEIREELGRGGMAMVFLAYDLRLNKKVAIKVLAPQLQSVPGMAARFLREAQTAAGLEHPNIIPIYGYREVDRFAFFAMRYVDGATLSGVARHVGRFPIPTVRALLWDIGGALSFAHANGVLHRDVKPGNVLLGRDGSVVVTDFGIAKQSAGQTLTMTGQLLGTPAYMSPEQCRGSELSFASDQYSLGIVAFELLTGRPPFTSGSSGELIAQHLTEPAPQLAALRPDCPPDLADAVMRMLEKHPASRFPSMDDALTAARAVPVLPSDPARVQLRSWADNPAVSRSTLSTTPISPPLGGMAPVSVVAAPAPAPPTPAPLTPAPLTPAPATPALPEPNSQVSAPVAASAAVPLAPAAPSSRRRVPGWLGLAGGAVAAALLGVVLTRKTPAEPPPPPPVTDGYLTVLELPADGATFIDGVRAAGTPVALAAGPHRVRLEAPGFVTAETVVQVAAGDTARLVFSAARVAAATRDKGTLVVSGLPRGGSVFVDGRRISGARVELDPGRHGVRIQAPGYVPVETVAEIGAGATNTLVFASPRTPSKPTEGSRPENTVVEPSATGNGVLMLRVRPFARVFVDGAFRAEDELLVIPLSAGRHVVRFEKPGYVTLEAPVMVAAGDTLKKSFTIQAQSP